MCLQMTQFHSFLWLIPLWTHTHTHTHIYYLFFIHSSGGEHLGYFHVLAIVSSAAVNIGIHQSFVIYKISNKDMQHKEV